MFRFLCKPYRWAATYSLILLAVSGLILLDTFVIPRTGTIAATAATQAAGAWQILSFGPALIDHGEIAVNQNHQAFRMAVGHLAAATGCIFFNLIYGLFGHEVKSASMASMFMYPLLGGAVPFLVIWLLETRFKLAGNNRLAINLYNSGIATLICSSLLKGVFEIAGTSSVYVAMMMIIGWMLTGVGLLAAGFRIIQHSAY